MTVNMNADINDLREIRNKAWEAMKADPNNEALELAWLDACDDVLDHDTYWHTKFIKTFNEEE